MNLRKSTFFGALWGDIAVLDPQIERLEHVDSEMLATVVAQNTWAMFGAGLPRSGHISWSQWVDLSQPQVKKVKIRFFVKFRVPSTLEKFKSEEKKIRAHAQAV